MEAVVQRLAAEDGMSTAEYAVGTVAACGFGGILVKLLSSPDVQQVLWQVIEKAFSFVL
ncbi:MAG: DUF4244 domain-containing protein [Candidatus Nanopelagicales bacterium]|jgi:hypothetical protein|nr:DUF4244 domain-containing protein [Actinomycetota bacterium]HNL51551.1 DUF4244 domain-containing protein [Actinomycetota bacterium]HNO15880.1 DUF4244 domain-containing protein [Actinomycetota bacterium]HUM86309.1 DUF4244 domain-containing protein [Actinomycetota bacterium]